MKKVDYLLIFLHKNILGEKSKGDRISQKNEKLNKRTNYKTVSLFGLKKNLTTIC